MARIKKTVAALLGLIVAVSVVVLIAKEWRRGRGDAEQSVSGLAGRGDTLFVYCFHNTVRCPTCRSIEAYTEEALREAFAEGLDAGRIQWQVVDIQQPSNEHFRRELDVIGPSIVLVRGAGDGPPRTKNLAEVLDLLDRKPAFIAYVQREVREMLAD
jgi:hypothetical protein